jgi:hypothetical protein
MRFLFGPSEDHNQPSMNPPRALVLAALLALPLSTFAADKKMPPAKPASEYTLFESHPNEKVTVAAEPCDKPDQCAFFRNKYIEHGFLPVRVIITNDGDKPLTLDDVRIQFISEDKDILPAALPEDLQRRLYSRKSAQGRRMPLPFPGASIPITAGEQVDKKITQDDQDFGFPSTTVAPHSTSSGYLFYDIRGLDDPAMRHATLFLKEIRWQGESKMLFDFNLSFDKWLAAQPKPPSKTVTPAPQTKDDSAKDSDKQ